MRRDILVFQLAVHYLPKIALRLERLFLDIQQACNATHSIIHHYALKNVIEIQKLIEKPELKSRFVKEFMRIEHLINKTQLTISNARYANLFVQVQVLNHMAGRFGEEIHSDPFLQSIRLMQSANECDGESYAPQLQYWLENKASIRQDDLTLWLAYLQSLSNTVDVYLALLRDTAQFEPIDMLHGFYQRPLPARVNDHLILIRMDSSLGMVPKMQLGHHGLSIRLCDALTMQEVRDTVCGDVEVAICQLY